jgi:hypothetical protein
MKASDYLLTMAAIFVSHTLPAWGNWTLGLICFVFAILFLIAERNVKCPTPSSENGGE